MFLSQLYLSHTFDYNAKKHLSIKRSETKEYKIQKIPSLTKVA